VAPECYLPGKLVATQVAPRQRPSNFFAPIVVPPGDRRRVLSLGAPKEPRAKPPYLPEKSGNVPEHGGGDGDGGGGM
jgi:hypothetical protein